MNQLQSLPLDTIITMSPEMMTILGINQLEFLLENEKEKLREYPEVWKFICLENQKKFNNERRYLISNYGRIFDLKKYRLKHPYDSWESSKGRYKSIKFHYKNKVFSCLVHRLVAIAFIPKDNERPFVNHINGIPYQNYIWNLEWCNTSENMKHAIDTGLKKEKRGEERSNAKWTDNEIEMICQMMEEGHKATYIYNAIGDILQNPKVTYERIHSLYKHIKQGTHWTHIAKKYNIDFTPFDYSKENSSLKKKAGGV